MLNNDSGCQGPGGKIAVNDMLSESEHPLRADARRNRERILASAREVLAQDGIDAQDKSLGFDWKRHLELAIDILRAR